MAQNSQKRQKKLQKQNAKRKTRRRELVQQKHGSLVDRLQRVSTSPVLHSCMSEQLWDAGIGYVFLSRLLPDGRVAFATFLLDVYCLGVKDAFANICTRSNYEQQVFPKFWRESRRTDISPADARKLVEEGVEYAEDLGFSPHRDYRTAQQIFGDIDPTESLQTFEFGKDGKPFYFAGPHDSAEKSRRIIETLARDQGSDNYHYLVPVSGSTPIDLDESAPPTIEEFRADIS